MYRGWEASCPPSLPSVVAVEQVGVFICGLFDDAVSYSDDIASNDGGVSE
jgi:hypothetical protein